MNNRNEKYYSELMDKIGYTFNDINLLIRAMTHSSYASEAGKSYRFNNERLEFLGDAYLDAIVGNKLYDILPDEPEGVLSKDRANVVCERSLADVSRTINLGKYLLLGKGEDSSGGRDKDSILADAMEAMIGAIICDGGLEPGRRVVFDLFDEQIRLAVRGKLFRDYKTELQERLQEKYRTVRIRYRLIDQKGPDHAKEFTASVEALGRVLGTGSGRSKKEAEQAAAQDVLRKGEI